MCKVTKTLWTALQNKLNTSINLGPLTPQSDILGFTEKCDDFYTKNHIFLIFKIFIYKYRNKFPTSAHLFGNIKAVAELEIASCAVAKRGLCLEKWENFISLLCYIFLNSRFFFFLFFLFSLIISLLCFFLIL